MKKKYLNLKQILLPGLVFSVILVSITQINLAKLPTFLGIKVNCNVAPISKWSILLKLVLIIAFIWSVISAFLLFVIKKFSKKFYEQTYLKSHYITIAILFVGVVILIEFQSPLKCYSSMVRNFIGILLGLIFSHFTQKKISRF